MPAGRRSKTGALRMTTRHTVPASKLVDGNWAAACMAALAADVVVDEEGNPSTWKPGRSTT